jgi:thiol-disulfide isomerase/thioredoxin
MEKYILLILILFFSPFSCGGKSEQDKNQVLSQEREDERTMEVAVSNDLNKELENLGFLTPKESIKAPDFTLKDLNAVSLSLSSLKGKVVFLNFWGSWCYYCREEMPSIQQMYNKLKNKNFEILAVNVNDTPKEAGDYIKSNAFTFPVVLDLEYQASQIYGIKGFPTTYVIDREGYLIGKLIGSRDWDTPEVIEVFNKILSHEP